MKFEKFDLNFFNFKVYMHLHGPSENITVAIIPWPWSSIMKNMARCIRTRMRWTTTNAAPLSYFN